MLQIKQPTAAVLPLSVQKSFSFMELTETPEMTVEQLRFRTDSEKLRERGIAFERDAEDFRNLYANALLQTLRAIAGKEGATPFLRAKAQNEAIGKCLSGDFEGLLDEVGIRTEAFLDEVRRNFPDEATPREALIKFARLVLKRYEAITEETEITRLRKRRVEFGDDFF